MIVMMTLMGLIALTTAATKCGDGAFWTDINANLVTRWLTDDKDGASFSTFKKTYDTKEATLITDTHPVTKGHCSEYFKIGVDKSCCQDADYKKYINQAVRATIRAAIPPTKGDPCKALKDGFFKAFSTCKAL